MAGLALVLVAPPSCPARQPSQRPCSGSPSREPPRAQRDALAPHAARMTQPAQAACSSPHPPPARATPRPPPQRKTRKCHASHKNSDFETLQFDPHRFVISILNFLPLLLSDVDMPAHARSRGERGEREVRLSVDRAPRSGCCWKLFVLDAFGCVGCCQRAPLDGCAGDVSSDAAMLRFPCCMSSHDQWAAIPPAREPLRAWPARGPSRTSRCAQ